MGKPRSGIKVSFEVTSTDPSALGGKATRKEVTMRLGGKSDRSRDASPGVHPE